MARSTLFTLLATCLVFEFGNTASSDRQRAGSVNSLASKSAGNDEPLTAGISHEDLIQAGLSNSPTTFGSDEPNLNNVGLSEDVHVNDVETALSGPNVCTKHEEYTVDVRVEEKQPYRQRTYTWCLAFPFRCTKYTIRIKTIYRTERIPKWRPVQDCCKGYERSANGTSCAPTCSQLCYHGKCVAPDVCECDPGFGGTACSKSCPPGKWGEDCGNECPCLNGAQCDPLTGECTCTPGWHGQQCNIKCPYRTFGRDCKEKCKCQNEGECDHVSGGCTCSSGWRGALCDEPCPPGTHGVSCKSSCQCQNGGSCHPESGKCYCPKGWTGQVCANPCPPGSFGIGCERRCDCYNGALCDHVNGRCRCLPGFQGTKCQEQCPHGKYGFQCGKDCECENGGTCNPIDGSCSCPDGWEGLRCEERSCQDSQAYGPDCSLVCSCDPHNTQLCHSWTGGCICKPGYAGYHCHRPCPVYTYGRDCRHVCDCRNDAFCNGTNGECTCAPGNVGDKCGRICQDGYYGRGCRYKCKCRNGARCHWTSGRCNCTDGWTGFYCDIPCTSGTFGRDCKQTCKCLNGASCDHVTGACQCKSGFKGKSCEIPCERGKYGINCAYRCDCEHTNSNGCDPVTGQCVCKPGWRGVRCESVCDRGRYGTNCQSLCYCEYGSSCDPQFGHCICARGFSGERCDRPCPKGHYGIGCRQVCPRYSSRYGSSCDYVSGQWDCLPGFTGFFCTEPCQAGTYGRRCMGSCSCQNNAECYHVDGECRCPGGWMGSNCTEPCPTGTFGPGCTRQCYCHNDATCNPVDGRCKCKPGYAGIRCQEYCQEGYWGQDCYIACQCKNNNFVCHPAQGCICKPGYSGADCSIPTSSIPKGRLATDPISGESSSSSSSTSAESNDSAGTIAGVVVVVFLGAAIIAMLLYCRYLRPAHRKKEERAHVTYTVGPSSSRTDHHHFDNPVYSTNFSDSATGQASFQLNNTCNLVVNKFSNSCKNNLNSDRERLRANGDTDCSRYQAAAGLARDADDLDRDPLASRGAFGCSSTFSYSTLSRKNLEANAQNPNLYTSLEDLKDNRKIEENIYDEIKQKQRTLQPTGGDNSNAPVVSINLETSSHTSDTVNELAPDPVNTATTHLASDVPETPELFHDLNSSYDKLDFNRPSRQLKPHYHSSSTLRSVKSSLDNGVLADDREGGKAIPRDTKNDSRNVTQDVVGGGAAGEAPHSSEDLSPRNSDRLVGEDFSADIFNSLSIVPLRDDHYKSPVMLRGAAVRAEPDSGISSAISSTTRPWSQNDPPTDASNLAGFSLVGNCEAAAAATVTSPMLPTLNVATNSSEKQLLTNQDASDLNEHHV